MGSKRRHQKKKRKLIGCEEVEEEEDRISSLPDSILHQILSFIDTTSVVQTSVLSKRWRYLWTSVPNIHLDYDAFPGNFHCETKKRRFAHFVNQVLSLRDASSVFRFYLRCTLFLDADLVKNCIYYAFRHNVQELLLWPDCNSFLEHSEFPGCLSEALGISSSSLISLTLACHAFAMPPDKPLRLPALKNLGLAGCCHDYANFITETVGNCTKLETLILDDLELNSLNINAPNLRNLELHYYDDDCSCGSCFESMIVISAPGLTSFKLEGHALPVFSAVSLPCLHNVHLCLKTWSFDEYESYDVPDEEILQRMPLNVMKMLEQLGEADYVTLSMDTVEALAKDPDSLNNRPSPFRKLKHLKLTTPSRSSNLPLNVIAYLTKGSSSDTLVGDFYSLGKWIRA
ncbi:hypothetical protein RHSIM_RhsimUnG0095700 [Rhododendron simsii]|uniref:F-box domain-containing protein n=1 Tax=Rhododendron simsii TaxID=118357 RepID=A0A834L558_RHOSS|nr:hypothetical protein RHSIM_RhsimUnG0095700 [Rhododendron simsii]